MVSRRHRQAALTGGSLLLTLVLGGYAPLLSTPVAETVSIAQARPVPEAAESRVRALSPAEFAALNLTPELEALIPDDLPPSRHPQDMRGTIGEDDRLELLSNRYPWSAIGRVVIEDANGMTGHCSGTLVAADIVLTNAHCVMSTETGELHRSISFQPNVVNNVVRDLADLAEAEAVFYGTNFQGNPSPPHPDDWAFLKLNQPLGDRYGTLPWMPLSLETLVEDYAGELVMVGYSGDYPRDRPASSAGVHLGCSILELYANSFTHDCDTFGGSSGGPILAWIGDQAYIVAINSAEEINTGTVIDTLTNADGSDRPIYAGVVNFGVSISRIVEFIEQVETPD